MKRNHLALVVLLLLQLAAAAQDSARAESKLRFRSFNSLGLIAGATDEEILVQSVNGFRKDRMFAGIGAGIDYYHQRSVPVFLELRRFFSRQPSSAFLYAGGGWNFAWKEDKGDEGVYTSSYGNGLYFDLGVGYTFSVGGREAFVLSAGYSGKNYSAKLQMPQYCPGGNCPPREENSEYKLHRIVLKAGIVIP
jgi:opacity protein-like surface antigen